MQAPKDIKLAPNSEALRYGLDNGTRDRPAAPVCAVRINHARACKPFVVGRDFYNATTYQIVGARQEKRTETNMIVPAFTLHRPYLAVAHDCRPTRLNAYYTPVRE